MAARWTGNYNIYCVCESACMCVCANYVREGKPLLSNFCSNNRNKKLDE